VLRSRSGSYGDGRAAIAGAIVHEQQIPKPVRLTKTLSNRSAMKRSAFQKMIMTETEG